jgi:hypothetical protein
MLTDKATIKTNLCSIDNDWKMREESLNLILKQLNTESEERQMFEFVSTIPELVAFQFADLRSGIVKLASEVVVSYVKCSRNFPEELTLEFSDKLVQEASFIKGLGSANKVIAKHTRSALQKLSVSNCFSMDTLKKMFMAHRNNKISQIRENVAESFAIFLTGLTGSVKKQLDSMFHVSNLNENSIGSKSIPSNDHQNDPSVIQTSQTGMTFESSQSQFKCSEQDGDLTLLTQKIKEENFDFLKVVCETFLKDSAPNVRNFGKNIKSSVSKIQELFLSGQETNVSQISGDFGEENDDSQRLIEGQVSGMLIESSFGNAVSEKPSKGSGGVSKTSQNRQLSDEERVLRVLEQDSKTAKDQTEELSKVVGKAVHSFVFSFEQFSRILTVYLEAKNMSLKTELIRLVSKSDFSNFQYELLDLWLREKLNKKISYNQLTKIVMDRISFDVLWSLMITRTYEELLPMLHKVFCPKQLLLILQRNTIEPQEIASSIQRNYLRTDNSVGGNALNYKNSNLLLLQRISNDKSLFEFFKNVEWNPLFVQKVRENQQFDSLFDGFDCQKSMSLSEMFRFLSVATTKDDFANQMNCFYRGRLNPNMADQMNQTIWTFLHLTNPAETTQATLDLRNALLSVLDFKSVESFPLMCLLFCLLSTAVKSPIEMNELKMLFIDSFRQVLNDSRLSLCALFVEMSQISPLNLESMIELLACCPRIDVLVLVGELVRDVLHLVGQSPDKSKFRKGLTGNLGLLAQTAATLMIPNQNLEVRKLGYEIVWSLKHLVESETFDCIVAGLEEEQRNMMAVYMQM